MNAESTCHVMGAGELYVDRIEVRDGDLVIAADGGYAHLKALGVEPRLIIGDFDSMDAPEGRAGLIRLPREKDDTDMTAALSAGLEQGYRRFHIYGGTGGRLDHTLANLQDIAWLSAQGARGTLFDRGARVTALTHGRLDFAPGGSGTLSVFAHGGPAEDVWLRGLKYPLERATLFPNVPLGVSNEFTGAPASVSVGRGTLLVFYPPEARPFAQVHSSANR